MSKRNGTIYPIKAITGDKVDYGKETNQQKEIKSMLKELNLSMYRLKGVFKRHPQQIWNAINTDKYPTLQKKIYNYLKKRIENKK